MNKIYRIFISSVKELLVKERETLSKIILSNGHLPVQMEYNFEGTSAQYSNDIDKEKIENSDCIILILSKSYGEIIKDKIGDKTKCPLTSSRFKKLLKRLKIDEVKNCVPCAENGCNLSFTEFEYYYALLCNKPVFALVDNNYLQGIGESTEKVDYLQNFINSVNKRHKYPYNSTDDFKNQCYDICKEVHKKITHPFSGLTPCIPLGIAKVYNNQKDLIQKVNKRWTNLISSDNIDTPVIRVLALRGNSFLPKQNAIWFPYIYGMKAPKKMIEITVGIIDHQTEQNRKKAFRKSDSGYYDERMESNITIKRDNVYRFEHKMSNIPFRMIFIGNFLFLSIYLEETEVADSPVLEVHKDSPLFKTCEAYYNSVEKIEISYE